MATCPKCGQATSILQKDLFTGACPQCRTGPCPQCRRRVTSPASLAFFTLILSGTIVAFYSRARDLELKVLSLRTKVQELNEAFEMQTEEIERLRAVVLRDMMERLKVQPDGDREDE